MINAAMPSIQTDGKMPDKHPDYYDIITKERVALTTIMKKVTVYTLSTCPVCKKMKTFLEENGIAYRLIEVDTLDGSEQWAATRELAKYNPQASYPTAVIEDVIAGYDIDALKAKLL
jgi:glutaredoxin